MSCQTATRGQTSGYIDGKLREIRWVRSSGSGGAAPGSGIWVHALDLCRALDWQRPSRILRVLEPNAQYASALGIRNNNVGDKYLDREGVEELFQRKTGGNRGAVYNFVWAV